MVRDQTIILSSGSSISTGNSYFNPFNSKLIFRLPNGLSLTDKDQIALKSVSIAYSWRNISSALNNNSFHYQFSGSSSKLVTIPDGNYSFSDFSNYFQFILEQNGDFLIDDKNNHVYYIKFSVNPIYYGFTLTLTPLPLTLPTGWSNPNNLILSGQTPQITVDNNDFGKYIGFSPGTYPSTSQTTITQLNSNQIGLVSNTTSILIGCNLVSNSYYQTGYSDIIESFCPNQQYGSQLRYEPFHLSFSQCGSNHYQQIEISFYDQSHQPLQILDSNGILVQLILRST